MNTKNLVVATLLISTLFFTSCATICGGSKYYAHVIVEDRPQAKIVYEGDTKGTGVANFKVKRKDANKFSFTVKEEGCDEQKFDFESRTFRGWAFAGTILGWTGTLNGIPLPWGVALDLITGAIWKPNVREKGVSKIDYKNFKYVVQYTNCTKKKAANATQQLIDVVYLKNGSIMKGTIIEQLPNVQIKLQSKDGSVIVYKMDEIEKILKESVK